MKTSLAMSITLEDTDCFRPPREPVSDGFKIFLYIAYAMMGAIGFSFNGIVIHVLLKCTEKNPMFWYLINVSGSYMLMAALCVPFTYTQVMNGMWVFPDFLCPVSQFVQLFSVSVTLFTLSAIAIERKFAICHPYSNASKWMSDHCLSMVFISWLVAGIYPSLFIWQTNTNTIPFVYKNQTFVQCRGQNVSQWKKNVIMTFNIVFLYLLPLLLIVWSYVSITRELNRPDERLRANASHRPDNEIPIKTVVIVAIAHTVCWSPINLYTLAWKYTSWWNCMSEQGYYTTLVVYFVAHWIAMMHIIVNPVVYCLQSQRFKNNLKQTWPYSVLFLNEPERMETRPMRTMPLRSPRFTFDETPLEVLPPIISRTLSDFANDPDIPYIDD